MTLARSSENAFASLLRRYSGATEPTQEVTPAPTPGPAPVPAPTPAPEPVVCLASLPPEEVPDPADLIRGAAADMVMALCRLSGSRWACSATQDAFHEGEDSEASVSAPVRLESFLRQVYDASLQGTALPDRRELAAAAVRQMARWEDSHDLHLFGQAVDADALLDALGRPGQAHPPVNYFRRYELPATGGLFRAGASLLAGSRLDLQAVTLTATPEPEATEQLYVLSERRYEVPPTAGERAEARAHGDAVA